MKLGKSYSAEPTANIEKSFEESIRELFGAEIEIIWDGAIHRFDTERRNDKAGWYCAFDHGGFRSAVAGDWRNSSKELRWHSGGSPTQDELKVIEYAREKARKKADEEAKKAALEAQEVWEKASPVEGRNHPYLQKKGVLSHGLRELTGYLIIPIADQNGSLISIQTISSDGKKLFFQGSRTSGGYFLIPGLGPIAYLCEGYATAASIHEATGASVYCSFSAHNLSPISKILRTRNINFKIIADNDKSGTGLEAAKRTGAEYTLIPDAGMDANDYAAAYGLDALKTLIEPKEEESDWLLPASSLMGEIKPPEWLIKGWIPKGSLCMCYGRPGSGKSFLTLDMALSIASGLENWHDERAKIKRGYVVYLTGEGHYGLQLRLSAWSKRNEVPPYRFQDRLYWSMAGEALEQPNGLMKAIRAIETMPEMPSLIVIDTLNRFFSGDENSAQETGLFIKAADELRKRFDAAVLIVHHSKKQATDENVLFRGSSALEGAMDAMWSVKKSGFAVSILQTKQKEGEMLEKSLALEAVSLGVFDEDGEEAVSLAIGDSIQEEEWSDESLESLRSVFAEACALEGIWDPESRTLAIPASAVRRRMEALGWTRTKIRESFRKPDGTRRLYSSNIYRLVEMGNIEILPNDKYSILDKAMLEKSMEIRVKEEKSDGE